MDNMFQSNSKFQVAIVCFMAAIIIDFLRNKRVKLFSTALFEGMLFCASAYLVFDILTVYTISNMQDSIINDICHKLFFFFLLTTVFSIALYVEYMGMVQKRVYSKSWIVSLIVSYVILVVCIFVSGIKYTVDENGVYSSGVSLFFLYIGIAIYTVLMFIETFRYRKYISPKKITALRMQLVMWVVVMIVQTIDPYLLLSGIAIVLTFLILYLSFENPSEYFDSTTGVFNIHGFFEVFSEKAIKSDTKKFKVIVLVIDDMDVVMTTIGRYRYDDIVKMIAQYLQECFAESVYRIDSDSLALISYKEGQDLERKLYELERRMNRVWKLEDSNILLKSHVTIIECPKNTKEPSEAIEYIRCIADADRNDFVRYVDENVVNIKRRKDTLNLMVVNAVEKDGFEVVYQPIYSTEKKKFVSAEALVRLKDKDTLGYVSPEEFVTLAEENGYVSKLGEQVFEKVCATIQKVKIAGLPLDYIEVNLSALQIIDENIVQNYKRIMNRYGVSPQMINLEITETAAVESDKIMESNMNEFRKLGCSFSMDDFGTGYSNLAKVAEVKYELVKLDKSLIWPCFDKDADEKHKIVLHNIIKMVQSIGVNIVAEGIETEEMIDYLVKHGVHYLQGYYFSKPISESEFLCFMEEYMNM